MIRSLKGKLTKDLFNGEKSRQTRKLPLELHGKAQRLLDQINVAPTVEFLRIPPSNRLEKLSGVRKGYWSMRINDQWRIIFIWQGDDAVDVEIIDYH